MPGHESHDPNQDAADAVKQRGMDATVDLANEPGEQEGIVPNQAPSKPRPDDNHENADAGKPEDDQA